MVNRGRPSRDCLPCRQRKLRCDLQPDGCGQCKRARLVCCGYREPGQLIIRDETHLVQRKVLLAKLCSPAARPPSEVHAGSAASISGSLAPKATPAPPCPPAPPSAPPQPPTQWPPQALHVSPPTSVSLLATTTASLQPSWEFRARAAFFTQYVFGLSRSHDTLAPLLAAASPHSALASAVDAASLAFLAHEAVQDATLRTFLSRLARASYVTAIRRLTEVIAAAGHPTGKGDVDDDDGEKEASSDVTLQSVLLLDLYEKLVFSTNTTVRPASDAADAADIIDDDDEAHGALMSHMRGALDLARVRGSRNFTSYIGRRLAMRLTVTLVISSLAAGQRVPRALEQLREELGRHLDSHDAKWVVTGLVAKTINLLADVREGRMASQGQAFRRAYDLDERFRALERELPASWAYERVSLEKSDPLVYGHYFDVYRDHFITQVRNVIRKMRLLLAEMLLNGPGRAAPVQLPASHVQLPAWGSGSASASASAPASVSRVIDQLSLDICASVPQFIWPRARTANRIPFTPLQILQCYTLLAPLYLSAQLSTRPDLRAWVLHTLDFMAESGGMRPAKHVADVLRHSPGVPYRCVYAMLGSYAFAA